MAQLFADNSRRNLRVTLFIIILATLPFYCIGFILWAAAPQVPANSLITQTATLPPVTREPTRTLAATDELPAFVTPTSFSPLQPTPLQFTPPGGGITFPTPFLPPTIIPPPVFIPTSTSAPTLTPIPQPTNTPVPPPTSTPPPPPTDTPVPPPTNTEIVPTSTTIPIFPTDTETPISAEAQTVGGENTEEPQNNTP